VRQIPHSRVSSTSRKRWAQRRHLLREPEATLFEIANVAGKASYLREIVGGDEHGSFSVVQMKRRKSGTSSL
jgi:hypothetical protein